MSGVDATLPAANTHSRWRPEVRSVSGEEKAAYIVEGTRTAVS